MRQVDKAAALMEIRTIRLYPMYYYSRAQHFWYWWEVIIFFQLLLVAFNDFSKTNFWLNTTNAQEIVLYHSLIYYCVESCFYIFIPQYTSTMQKITLDGVIKLTLSIIGNAFVLISGIGGGIICTLMLDVITFIVGEVLGYSSKFVYYLNIIVRYVLYTFLCFLTLFDIFHSIYFIGQSSVALKIFAFLFTIWTPYAFYYNIFLQ